MADSIDVDINVNMNNIDEVDELTAKLQESTSEAENLQAALSGTDANISADVEVDDSQLDETQSKIEDMNNEEINVPVNTDDSDVDETKEKIEETSSSASSLGLALSGAVASLGIEQAVEKADNFNTSWNQLKLTFGANAQQINNLKSKTNELGSATGRAGSTIRGYFNDMGIAGVKNTNLLADSFQALSGRSYQTGNSIESMEQKMKMMVMSGNVMPKTLTGLGISMDALAKSMGVSADEVSEAFKNMTPEERLQAITKAMGDGKQANEMYKQSFAGLKEQMSIAIGSLMVAIGQGVLPTVIPIVQGVTGAIKTLAGAFRSLPGPVQGVIGGLGGFLAVGATAVGTLGMLGKVGSGVVDGLGSLRDGYRTLRDAMSGASTVMDTLRNSETLMKVAQAASSAASTVRAGAESALTAVKTAALGPTITLAGAEVALLWPLLLLVGAIVAVVAVLWHLYNTNEDVRNAFNWLAGEVQKAGQEIYNAIVPVVQEVIQYLEDLCEQITTVGGLMPETFEITGDKATDSFLKIGAGLATLPLQMYITNVNATAQALGFGNNFMQVMVNSANRATMGFSMRIAQLPGRIQAYLVGVLTNVAAWGQNLIARGVSAATGFVNGVRNTIAGVVGAISSALSGVVGAITRPFQQAYDKVKGIIDSIKSAAGSIGNYLGASYYGVDFGGGLSSDSTLNNTLSAGVTNNSNTRNANINNNFYGLVEESAAEYIINTVNERLRKENMVRGV